MIKEDKADHVYGEEDPGVRLLFVNIRECQDIKSLYVPEHHEIVTKDLPGIQR